MNFFIPLKSPPTHTAQQGHRTTATGKHYTDPQAASIRALYQGALIPHKPAKPMTGPIRLIAKFLFPKTKTSNHAQPKISKPDCDNLIKLFQDAMQDVGFFRNDSQIASLIVEKYHSDTTGIYVEIAPLVSGRPENMQPDGKMADANND